MKVRFIQNVRTLPFTSTKPLHATAKWYPSIKRPYIIRPLVSPSRMLRVDSMAKRDIKPVDFWWEKDKEHWVDVASVVTLEEALHCTDYRLCLVDWYATWCHGCRKTSPLLTELASNPDLSRQVKFVRVCIDSMADHARKQGVRALPYVTIHDNQGKKLVGFGAAASKGKTFRKNLETVLDNPEKDYSIDPNGFVIALDKMQSRIQNKKQDSEVEELRKFSAELSKKLDTKRSISTPALFKQKQKTDVIEEKQRFLDRYGHQYGYNGFLNSIYETELGRRLGPNQHYMDYTGSSVYTQSQLEAIHSDLTQNLFGNPHSESPSSTLTRDRIEEIRRIVLDFFDADPKDYQVIFTTSATAALKLIAENYPWTDKSTFKYLRENHNSVLGMREYVLKAGGDFESISEEQVDEWISQPGVSSINQDSPNYHLFAFPAEDNFAGVKYPLSWIYEIQKLSTEKDIWKVVLDAAAFVGTQPLSLRQYPADYVAISFYKMFGYPTGLGALLMKTDAIDILDKVFWAGGSVALATSKDDFHVLKCRPTEKYEDGTVSFLEIMSLKHGFDSIDRFGGIHRIQSHVRSLTEWLYNRLTTLTHTNGSPLVKVFGKHGQFDSYKVQGGILNFELLGANGKVLSYKAFELEASRAGFHIRTGIECNPGAAYNYIGIKESEVESLAGLTEGCDDEMEYIQVPRSKEISLFSSVDTSELNDLKFEDMMNHTGSDERVVRVPLGSVRLSLGYMSTFEDCLKFAEFLEETCKDKNFDNQSTYKMNET